MGARLETFAVGLAGAGRRLVGFVVILGVLAAVPNAVASLGNTGAVDTDAFLPGTMASEADLNDVAISGATSTQADSIRTALGELVWPVQTSSFTLVVDDGKELPPEASAAYAYPSNVIYVRDSVVDDPRAFRLSHVLAHELGHMLDAIYLDSVGRTEFLAARGYPSGTLWRAPDGEWALAPAEDFAEVFAALAAPSSGARIATRAGRIADAPAMRALIERYQNGQVRRVLPTGLATVAAVARQAVGDIEAQPWLLGWLTAIAAVAAVSGARDAVWNRPFRTPRKRLAPATVAIR